MFLVVTVLPEDIHVIWTSQSWEYTTQLSQSEAIEYTTQISDENMYAMV
jgi:hypothetical protein